MSGTDADTSARRSDRASLIGLCWAVAIVVATLAARAFEPYGLLYLPFGWTLDLVAPTASDLRSVGRIGDLLLAAWAPVFAYAAIGWAALRRLPVAARGAERLALAWLLGTGATSLGILALRSLDVPVTPIGLAALAAVLVLVEWRPRRAGERAGPAPDRTSAASVIDLATLVVAGGMVAAALGPEVSWDALEYHLPIAKAWTEGPIRALPGVFDAELRMGIDLLYIPAMAAGAPDAAAVVTAGFALSLAALVRAETTRMLSPVAGAWCGLLTLLSPIVLTHAVTAYTDLAVGAYGFGALLAAHRWNRGGERRLAELALVLAAFAANAKLHAAVLVPAVLLLLVMGGRPFEPRRLVFLTTLAFGVMLPWFLKSAITTGNPFFPVQGDVFGLGASDAAHVAIRAERLALDLPPELRSLPAYLHELAFGDHPYLGGLLGPLPLAFAAFALGRLDRATVALTAVWTALFALQFLFAPSLRFGIPLLPFVALASSRGACRLARTGRRSRVVIGTLCAAVAAFQATSALGAYLPRIAAIRAPAPYERAVWPSQISLREMVARLDPVVAIPMGAVSWMPKPVYLLIGERNGEIFASRDSAAHIFEIFERRGVRSVVLPMPSEHVTEGRLDHPIFGEWIRKGWLRRRDDIEPRPAFPGRVWVAMDVVPSPEPAPRAPATGEGAE